MAGDRGRQIGLYFAWSRPDEIRAADPQGLWLLENRYPTLFEFRRAIWPHYEHFSDPAKFKQDISGFLDHVVLYDFLPFGKLIEEFTGHPIRVIQRVDDRPPVNELDDELLKNLDTLIVVSLDHFRTQQRAKKEEIEAIAAFLTRQGRCLIVCPHHHIGTDPDQPRRLTELRHHGDPLVPSQQEIGGFARTLLAGLGFAIENRFGLNPAQLAGDPAPLLTWREADDHRVLEGVGTFNRHPHLPHLYVPPAAAAQVRVLARQPINLAAAPHPFVEAGNRYFNALLHVPPAGMRAGDIFVCDATLWSLAFGGEESLKRFWRNLVSIKR